MWQIIVISTFIFFNSCRGQEDKEGCNHLIDIDLHKKLIEICEIGINEEIVDTIDGSVYYLNFDNLKGEGKVQMLYANGNKALTGEYISGDSLIQDSVGFENLTTGAWEVEPIYYYQPKRNGSWYFYSEDGELIKEEVYLNGELQEVRKLK